mmetsp:Transcript_49457/g.78253  ORF Transcript_49457/g.78253 Transcript_49457/m.78253 type:complete len:81 (-) Transcript_49457:108-350(-)
MDVVVVGEVPGSISTSAKRFAVEPTNASVIFNLVGGGTFDIGYDAWIVFLEFLRANLVVVDQIWQKLDELILASVFALFG